MTARAIHLLSSIFWMTRFHSCNSAGVRLAWDGAGFAADCSLSEMFGADTGVKGGPAFFLLDTLNHLHNHPLSVYARQLRKLVTLDMTSTQVFFGTTSENFNVGINFVGEKLSRKFGVGEQS
jgi:phage major head subunit gpT-like protein